MGILDRYRFESSFDEMIGADGRCRPHWQSVYDRLEDAGIEGLRTKQSEIDWGLEENGVTYNVYDAPEGHQKRSWSLDPVPFILTEAEWDKIAAGIRQRARLFDLIFRDLYGEQRLLKENIIPPEVIFAHKGFAPELFGFGTKRHFELLFYAVDIARGPDGKFWVLGDRVQAHSGLGYAVENRLSMNVISQSLYPKMNLRRIVGFFDDMKAMIARLSGGDCSTAALLSPGPFNETYFEHAYLSSLLDISLVQGEDLLVKEGALWLKNLSGLSRINTLLRRVDDRYCDPLELKNDSRLGVAGLVDAMRREQLSMINPIGSAILENLGLNPFMKHAARFFLGEELLLPQIATWWCGQPKELEYVLEHLDRLVVKHINRMESEAYIGRKMLAREREKLKKRLIELPHLFVAQEEIGFSTVPFFTGSAIEPRNAVIRAYALKRDDGYRVLDGGLVRVSAQKDLFLISSQQGGSSKDLWIIGEEKTQTPHSPFQQLPCVDAAIELIPTRQAENLFWMGRYLARALMTTRLIRYVVKRLVSVYRDEANPLGGTREPLLQAVTHMTMTYPGFLDAGHAERLMSMPLNEIVKVLKDPGRPGSLTFTLSMLSGSNVGIKNMLGIEAWKLDDKLRDEWQAFCRSDIRSGRGIVNELDKLHIYLLAYKELVDESMSREQGLVLYEIGFTIESALLLISKARSLLSLRFEKETEYELLEALLNSCESFNAYRAHYKSSLKREHVIAFLLLNTQFPKSLTYMTAQLLDDLKTLPKSGRTSSGYEAPIVQAAELLAGQTPDTLLSGASDEGVYERLDAFLSGIADAYITASNEFTKTYFAHYDE